jgi:hypothetical protein
MELTNEQRRQIVHLNCYKLFLCNTELKHIFQNATRDEIQLYNSNDFLLLCIESLNINFCMLSGILISKQEKFSLTRYMKDFIFDSAVQQRSLAVIEDGQFQTAWRKVKVLRDKYYAHNDIAETEFHKEIQLTQPERNIVTEGLIKVLAMIYGDEPGDYLASFTTQHSPGIQMQLRMGMSFKSNLLKDLNETLAKSKGH